MYILAITLSKVNLTDKTRGSQVLTPGHRCYRRILSAQNSGLTLGAKNEIYKSLTLCIYKYEDVNRTGLNFAAFFE